MGDAISKDLVGDRGVPFLAKIKRVGVDYTGWAFSMQVRYSPDAPGSPIISLGSVTDASSGILTEYAGTDTIANHIAAGRLTSQILQYAGPNGTNYALSDRVAMTALRIFIAQAMMSSPNIPPAAALGEDAIFAWDMLGDDGAGPDILQKLFYGTFRVRGTVTQ